MFLLQKKKSAFITFFFNKEKIATIVDFKKNYGNQPRGNFIRTIIGLDIQAVQAAFSTFFTSW